MRGIRTSSRIRSGTSLFAFSTASTPFTAVITSKPPNCRVRAIRSRMSGSSSAMSILCIARFTLLVLESSCRLADVGKLRGDALKDGRQPHVEGAARAFLALYPDAPVVHLDDLLHDGQAEARARRAEDDGVALAPVESLEDALQVCRRDADAGVLHVDLHAAVLA